MPTILHSTPKVAVIRIRKKTQTCSKKVKRCMESKKNQIWFKFTFCRWILLTLYIDMDAHNMNIVHIHTLEPCEFSAFPFFIINSQNICQLLMCCYTSLPSHFYILCTYICVCICMCLLHRSWCVVTPLACQEPWHPFDLFVCPRQPILQLFLIYFTVNIPSYSCFKIYEKKKGHKINCS